MSGEGGAAVDVARVRGPADRVVTVAAYRPHLDGLRAVAVYLVVLFHAGLQRFAGGFIGVDVFFVLSGFLVTRLLVRDLGSGGSIRFGRFYARRFRRLLPAAFVALIATALIVVALDPVRAAASLGAFKAAFLYSANWYFIRESTGYFGAEVASSPVLQFWSLAVEEQFYLAWPVVLAGLFSLAGRVPRNRLLVVRLAVALGAVASLGWALHLRTADPNRAYFGTDARAYQLLAGASLALAPALLESLGGARRVLRWLAPAAIVGLVVAGTSVGGDDPIIRGVVATVLTGVAIVALEGEGGGWTTRILSSPALVYLGRVSYGTYLWHWPVVLIATEALELGARETAALTCVVATGVASLSYELLERPVRASSVLERHRLAVIATGLTVSVVAALVIVPAIVEPRSPGSTAVAASTTSGFTPVPDTIDLATIYDEGYGKLVDADGQERTCVDAPVDACTVVRGSGAHLVLIGDSNAQMLTGALVTMAEDHDLTLSVVAASGCPWQRGIYVLWAEVRDNCRRIREDAYDRVIPELDPDVVIAMNTGTLTDQDPGDPAAAAVDPEIEAATVRSAAELTDGGRSLVIIEPMPRPPSADTDPFSCLTTSPVVEACRYLAATEPDWHERLTRKIAAGNDHVLSADFDRLVCPFLPICDPIVGGEIVKWDWQHLTARFSRTLSEPMANYLDQHGLLTG